MDLSEYTINCTGDVCKGDFIMFEESVFPKYNRYSRKQQTPLGKRLIVGEVVNESYGEKKQQHTFTIKLLHSDGYDPLDKINEKIKRMGRTIYRNGTKRKVWNNELDRLDVLNEKHSRGNHARHMREIRKNYQRESI